MGDVVIGRTSPDRPAPVVLHGAVDAARYAPSIHNTQPWRWHVGETYLDLYADRSRQLGAADPQAHLLTLSCGAALHQAEVALGAQGWEPAVTRLPEAADPDLLARIDITGPAPAAPEAIRHLQAVLLRRTERRPVGREPVSGSDIAAIRHAAESRGAHVHPLRDEQVVELSVAASHAEALASSDPELRAELARWVGGIREQGTSVPDEVIPEAHPRTRVLEWDSGPGRPGAVPPGPAHDEGAVYLLLFGDDDTPQGWLLGGEALMECWLVATEQGLSVMPLSAVVEVPATRSALRHILGRIGYPYLVLRVGVADAAQPGPSRTPRLPAETLIDLPDPHRPGRQQSTMDN